MRYGMRIGRGAWVAGGGGVLMASTISALLYATMMLSAWVVATALGLIFSFVAYALQNTKSARRVQLAEPLRGSLDATALGALDSRTKVWAVYAVRDQFHYGIDPTKGEELLRLYSDREAQIARVAHFPDAARARSAAARLQQQGYSFAELLKLFPNNYTPGHGLDKRALPAPLSADLRAQAAELAHVVSARRAARRTRVPRTRPLEAQPIQPREPTIINPKERPMSKQKDTTQYTFDSQTMGKGRLVLALVKCYVRENPDAVFEDVRAAFPDELQADSPLQFTAGHRCVVARIDVLPSDARTRFFVDDGETIELKDGVIVVSREWNLFNIQNILRRARELGYEVAVASNSN